MKAINSILSRGLRADTTLGYPHPDDEAGNERRLNYWSTLTNGRGFRQPKTKRVGSKLNRGSISKTYR